MRYQIRYLGKYPKHKQLIVFASGDKLDSLKELDFEKTQIVDTETGEIMSDFGKRSKEYGTAYKRIR